MKSNYDVTKLFVYSAALTVIPRFIALHGAERIDSWEKLLSIE